MSLHSHGSLHMHSHTSDLGSLSVLGVKLFKYDPLSNAVLAVSIVTAITQILIACSPPLSGIVLHFLVAFAEGGALGAIFIHMLPEIQLSASSGLVVIFGFLIFVSIDKSLRIVAESSGNAKESSQVSAAPAHTHSHSHSRSHSRAQSKVESDSDLQASAKPADSDAKADSLSMQNISPFINVIADSLHNVTDGIALAMAFHQSTVHGFSAFVVMCCHEIPHQFGDFALLINSGATKSSARKLQLITALGTVAGCLLGHWLGALGSVLEEVITPLTTGVLLYVATLGIMPEMLETDASSSTRAKIGVGLVQWAGVICGICMVSVLD